MEKYTNEYGKECWKDATLETPFTADIFHDVEHKPSIFDESDYDREYQVAFHSNLGSLTVLDRRTGFGWRDTETGYRCPDGKFWLASGMFDVRKSEAKTIGEAIEWVKKNANNCIGA